MEQEVPNYPQPESPEIIWSADSLPPVEFTDIIRQSQLYRSGANILSDFRKEAATPLGVAILLSDESKLDRILCGTMLAGIWYTDRQDGILARKSIALLEKLCEAHPELAEYEPVKHLLSREVRDDGAKRDHEADKSLSDRVRDALLLKAIFKGDVAAITILALDKASKERRKPAMQQLRDFGERQGVDVKANAWGKAKTAMEAVGQGMMVCAKTGTFINRLGLLMIGSSNIPAWMAVDAMEKHIYHELGIKTPKEIRQAQKNRNIYFRTIFAEAYNRGKFIPTPQSNI